VRTDWPARQKEMERWYDELSAEPDTAAADLFYDYQPHIRALAALEGSVLDVGGGAGLVGAFLPPESAYVVLDPSPMWNRPEWREIRGRFLPRDRRPPLFVRGIGEALPFGPAAFDHTVSFCSLNHAQDPEAVIRELHRVLRPGGSALLVFEDMEPTAGDVLRHAPSYLPVIRRLKRTGRSVRPRRPWHLRTALTSKLLRRPWPAGWHAAGPPDGTVLSPDERHLREGSERRTRGSAAKPAKRYGDEGHRQLPLDPLTQPSRSDELVVLVAGSRGRPAEVHELLHRERPGSTRDRRDRVADQASLAERALHVDGSGGPSNWRRVVTPHQAAKLDGGAQLGAENRERRRSLQSHGHAGRAKRGDRQRPLVAPARGSGVHGERIVLLDRRLRTPRDAEGAPELKVHSHGADVIRVGQVDAELLRRDRVA
jgi:SAM-dependent methyltransferase